MLEEIKNKIKESSQDEEKFKFENTNLITTINEEIYVYDLELIKNDKYLLVSLNKSLVKIYKLENMELISSQKLIEENCSIYHIYQISEDYILPSINHKNIYLFKLNNKYKFELKQELVKSEKEIIHAIQLKNENIAAISEDNNIYIWKKINNINKYQIYKIYKEKNGLNDIIEVKSNIIAFDCWDYYLGFYDFNENKRYIINKIDVNPYIYGVSKFCLINENFLVYVTDYKVYIADLNIYNVIDVYNIKQTCLYFHKLKDNILLCGNSQGNIIQYKFKDNKLNIISYKESVHSRFIWKIINSQKGYIISASDDSTIKLWSY